MKKPRQKREANRGVIPTDKPVGPFANMAVDVEIPGEADRAEAMAIVMAATLGAAWKRIMPVMDKAVAVIEVAAGRETYDDVPAPVLDAIHDLSEAFEELATAACGPDGGPMMFDLPPSKGSLN